MKFKFDKVDEHEFHEKFAWLPEFVSDESDKNTVVVFETYIRRMSREYDNPRKGQRIHWEQYSKKEYFKRKLKGEFEIEKTGFAEMSHDGSNMQFTGAGSVGVKVLQGTGDVEVWDEQGNIIQSYTLDSNGNEV